MFRRRQFLRRVQVIALTKDVTGQSDHVALLERVHACNRDAPEFSCQAALPESVACCTNTVTMAVWEAIVEA